MISTGSHHEIRVSYGKHTPLSLAHAHTTTHTTHRVGRGTHNSAVARRAREWGLNGLEKQHGLANLGSEVSKHRRGSWVNSVGSGTVYWKQGRGPVANSGVIGHGGL